MEQENGVHDFEQPPRESSKVGRAIPSGPHPIRLTL